MNDVIIKRIDRIRKEGYRPEVAACFLHNGRLLFLYKKEHDLWQFPQGGIKNRESPGEALLREMTEELGEELVDNCFDEAKYFYKAKISFKVAGAPAKNIQDDQGGKKGMLGKNYFFFYIMARSLHLDINKTEFDDYAWHDRDQSLKTINAIYQTGKKRIYKGAFNRLVELELLR